MDRGLVYHVGSTILAHQLAGLDPATVDQSYLALAADLSVRAAMELDAALERADKAKSEADRAAEEACRAEVDRVAAEERAKSGAADQSKPQDPQKPPAPPLTKAVAPETKAPDATA